MHVLAVKAQLFLNKSTVGANGTSRHHCHQLTRLRENIPVEWNDDFANIKFILSK